MDIEITLRKERESNTATGITELVAFGPIISFIEGQFNTAVLKYLDGLRCQENDGRNSVI